MSCVPFDEFARGLRLVKAATHCENGVRLRQCPLRLSLSFRLFSRLPRDRDRFITGGVSVLAPRQSRLNSKFAVQSFLYRSPYVPQVYSLLQRNVTDRIMPQIMSSEAKYNYSLVEKGDLVAIGTGLAKSLILSGS